MGGRRVVRVLPDVVGIDKEFDYLVPDGVEVAAGDVVRIDLAGRRVGGWVVAVDVSPAGRVGLRPLAKLSGRGPSPELIELARWAAWRWAGRPAHLLRTASPPGVVSSATLARPGPGSGPAGPSNGPDHPGTGAPDRADVAVSSAWTRALALPRAVLRLPPGADRYGLVRAAVAAGPGPLVAPVDSTGLVDLAARADPAGAGAAGSGTTLVLCPSVAEARALGRRLRRDAIATAVVAHDRRGAATQAWAQAASGAARVVVGARAAAWAPAPDLARVVVLDEHDEAYQQEQTPTWHARDVGAERARRAGAPCLLVSPCPTLEALDWGRLVELARPDERDGWPRIEIIDQRDLDPSLGPLFSPRLVDVIRGEGTVVCVLNRTGRIRLLACAACRSLARCVVCTGALSREEAGDGPSELVCRRCGTRRPVVCATCGATAFKSLRLGVSRVREELEALAGEPVGEITASTGPGDPASGVGRIVVGTEAVLHRMSRATAVAFLDFDQELLSLRWRAGEQALAMVARAARLVRRGSGHHGRILVQTRTPDHPALMAARHADPGRLVTSELPLRRMLGLPPTTAVALVSGQAGEAFMAGFGAPDGVVVQGPVDGTWRLRAPDHQVLCDALAGVERPPGRLRIEVDPLRA